MSKDIEQLLLNLIKDLPDDTVLLKYMDGTNITVQDVKNDIDSEKSKDYFSNLLRISRDILKRQAIKNG